MVSQGVSMLWSGFIPKKKAEERMKMKMSDLVESVSKKPLDPWQRNLLVEVMVSDEDDEDVEVSGNDVSAAITADEQVPYVLVHI
jgi:ubiquitin-activating enzyme E1